MKAIDTNILVSFLVKDDDQQAEAAYRVFKQVEADRQVLFIPMLVVLETVWVLESVYAIKRQEILDCVEELLLMPVLEFEAQPAIRSFVTSARESKADLADLLITQSARFSGCECVLTFDRRASRLDFFEILK